MVGQDLGKGEGSLDGQTDAAEDADVGIRFGDRGEVDHGQDDHKVRQEQPVPAVAMS